MKSKVVIEWKFKERPTIKPKQKIWLARIMHAVKVGYKTVPWVAKNEIKAWCEKNDSIFNRETVDGLCVDNGLMVHSWGPGCVYFKKAEA